MAGFNTFRLTPQGPPQLYQSFTIKAPIATHWRPGTCYEDDCDQYVNGFYLDVDESDLHLNGGAARAHYIRHDKSRKHTEERLPTGLTRFAFPPGTNCFGKHIVRSDRPSVLVVRGGDYRGNPLGDQRVHKNANDWTEHLHETLDKVQAQQERA